MSDPFVGDAVTKASASNVSLWTPERISADRDFLAAMGDKQTHHMKEYGAALDEIERLTKMLDMLCSVAVGLSKLNPANAASQDAKHVDGLANGLPGRAGEAEPAGAVDDNSKRGG
jgi:hypothetical protein